MSLPYVSPAGDWDPTKELDKASDKVRQAMRERALASTYYLTYMVLGYDKLTVHTHLPLCTFLDTCTATRRLIQMPRSHFKTTITTVSHRIKEIVKNPGRRILIVGDTLPNARKHLQKIKLHFDNNQLFRWLFPEVIWEDTSKAPAWSQDQIYVPFNNSVASHGEPTVDVIGARGAVVSRHYDTINPDDIIGEDEYYSSPEMEKTIDWFTGLEALFTPPLSASLMDIPSTCWRTDDVYAFAEEFYGRGKDKVQTGPFSYQRGEIAVFRRSAIEDGKLIFPEGITMEYLERLQEKNPERYAAQYANNPHSSAVAFFKPEYLKFYDVIRDEPGPAGDFVARIRHDDGTLEIVRPEDYFIISMCDPHAGGSKKKRFKGGRAAVITTGVNVAAARVVIFDCWIKRAPTNLIIDEIFRQNERWMPQVFSIEANGLQKMLKYWIDERTERDGKVSVPYVPYVPKSEKSSELRIRGLQPMFRAGQIYANRGFMELWDEYYAWPRGGEDGLDCLAQGLEYWNVGWDNVTDEQVSDYERAIQRMRNTVTGY